MRILDDDRPPAASPAETYLEFAKQLRGTGSGSVLRLARDVATHACFLATLGGIFGDTLQEPRLRWALDEAPPTARLETLARIRRYVGQNSELAWAMLGQLRVLWGLPPVDEGMLVNASPGVIQ